MIAIRCLYFQDFPNFSHDFLSKWYTLTDRGDVAVTTWLDRVLSGKVLAALVCVALALIVWHWQVAENDGERIRFIATVSGMIAVVYSLLLNAKQMFDNAQAIRSGQAIRLIERWSDPVFRDNRVTLRKIWSNDLSIDLDGSPDSETHRHLVAVSNFFEEMGIAISLDKVDEQHLWLFFGQMVPMIHAILTPWIIKQRRDEQDRAFREFESLAERWRDRAP